MLATLVFHNYHLVEIRRSMADNSLPEPREVCMRLALTPLRASLEAVRQQAMWSEWAKYSYLLPTPIVCQLFYMSAFVFEMYALCLVFYKLYLKPEPQVFFARPAVKCRM
jgi:hypothetical protein